jgi:hypothetical protein
MATPSEEFGPARHPLIPWNIRTNASQSGDPREFPELMVTIGADDHGAGMTVTVREYRQGLRPSVRVLWSRRWNSRCQSVLEVLEVAERGLAAVLAEQLGYPEP